MSKLFDSDDEGAVPPTRPAGKAVPTFKPKAAFNPDAAMDGPMFANPIVGAGAPATAASQQQLPGALPSMPVNIVQQYVDNSNAIAAANGGVVPTYYAGQPPPAAAKIAAPAAGKPFDSPPISPTSVTPAKASFALPSDHGRVANPTTTNTAAATGAPIAGAPQQQQQQPYYQQQPAAAAPSGPYGTAYPPLQQPTAAPTAAAAAAPVNPTANPWTNMTESSANFLQQPNPWGGPTAAPTAAAAGVAPPQMMQQQQYPPQPQQQQYQQYPPQQQQYVPSPDQILQQQQAMQQQQQLLQQQAAQFAAPLPPLPPAPEPLPTLSHAVWPADLPALPPAPEQGKIAELSPLPPSPNAPLTNDPLRAHLTQTTNDTIAWESFLQLRKQLEDAHQHTINLHGQISQIQLSHEKEASQFREAAQNRIETQRKEIEQAVENYNTALSKIDNLSSILNKKAENLLALEQRVHELSVENAAANQRIAHTDDRARVADAGRQVAEVRQRELELTLEHTSELVVNLRRQMQGSHEEKTKALHEQYHIFESYRQNLINYYNERERKQSEEFNLNIKQVQALMDMHVKEREEKISKHWKETILTLENEYRDIKKANEDLVRRHNTEKDEFKREQTLEKEKWVAHLRSEMTLLEQRHKEREDHVLTDIARRERELSEREQRARVQRAQDEQDAKINLMSKEAELKAYYEKMAEDMRKSHDSEREKTSASFRDQIQQLQNQHLNNERELERMHREKEREMAQRYRIAGYEVEDQKTHLDLQNVSTKTQSSLLSKFDSIEAKQRERAEQTRQAIKTTSLSGIATTAGLGAATGGTTSAATTSFSNTATSSYK